MDVSARNLELLLAGKELEPEALELLKKRKADREKVKKMIEDGRFTVNEYGVAYVTIDKKVDAGLVPAFLPEAKVIVIGSKMPDGPEKKGEWEIKVRLGMAAPPGTSLNNLGLPDFGGRWNAGSTKRNGGTNIGAEEYAKILGEKLNKL